MECQIRFKFGTSLDKQNARFRMRGWQHRHPAILPAAIRPMRAHSLFKNQFLQWHFIFFYSYGIFIVLDSELASFTWKF